MPIGTYLFRAALALVIAGIVHLSTVLAVPHLSTNDAWSRLGPLIDDEAVAVLPTTGGGDLVPLLDPNVVYAACRFDVASAPFAVSAPMPPGYWSISLHTPRGIVFYAINDEAATGGVLELELRDGEAMRQRRLAQVSQIDEGTGVLAIETPTVTGYALMRGLVTRGARREEVEAAMAETFCGPIEETVVPKSEPKPPAPSFPFPPQRPDRPS